MKLQCLTRIIAIDTSRIEARVRELFSALKQGLARLPEAWLDRTISAIAQALLRTLLLIRFIEAGHEIRSARCHAALEEDYVR